MLYVSLLLLLFLNLAGGILVKISPQYYHDLLSLAVLAVLLACIYGLRSVLWLILGKRYQLSFLYPALGINYVLSLFVGMAVFHEPLSWWRFAGAGIILCGIFLLSFSKHRNEVRTVKVFE